jgi:uncharacterized protein YdiU (UPF0061 family)
MAAGFVHGVLNTDNINVTGESFDYGPWRFLPHYDPGFTAAYFDETGLYAFGRQPDALLWNLYRLAECLLPLAPQDLLEQALASFEPALHREFAQAVLRRLGLQSRGFEHDGALAKTLWTFLHETRAPFEQTFFDWYGGVLSSQRAEKSSSASYYAHESFQVFRTILSDFSPSPGIKPTHSYFERPAPCTMLIDEVEAIWSPIAAEDDWSLLAAKLDDIRAMAEAYRTA